MRWTIVLNPCEEVTIQFNKQTTWRPISGYCYNPYPPTLSTPFSANLHPIFHLLQAADI